jgi:hypothetical protein
VVVESLLAASWEELEQRHLEDFLHDAHDEGLTWEVKGDRKTSRWPRPEQVYEPACAFANSLDGGLLIIGAERRQDERGKAQTGWDLRGLLSPREEIPLWIGRQIDRLRPRPSHWPPKVWKVGEGRIAAAVLIEPVPDPPCVTPDGRVLQRTSGASIPVTDPTVLARLQERGQSARKQAEDTAEMVATWARDVPIKLQGGPAAWPVEVGHLTVGMAATGYESDIGSRLFHETFPERLRAARHELPAVRGAGPFDEPYHRRLIGQGFVAGRFDPQFLDDFEHHWAVVAHWSGGVAITTSPYRDGAWDLIRDEALRPAFKVAADLVSALGGLGPRYCYVLAEPEPPVPEKRGLAVVHYASQPDPVFGREGTARWIEEPEPTEDDLRYVLDELRRGAGEEVWLSDPNGE